MISESKGPQILRHVAPLVPPTPKPAPIPEPHDEWDVPAPPNPNRFGKAVCFRCGRQLYRNNRSHICYQCQRKWGLLTLKRRVKPLQEFHLSVCRKRLCPDPAHIAGLIPARPRKRRSSPKSAAISTGSRPSAESTEGLGPMVVIDRVTSNRLARRALARSGQLGFRVTKADLIREAIREHLKNHPATEFYTDASPGEDEP